MTTTTNIQVNSNGNGAALNQNNNFEKVAKMTITNHIQGIFNNNIKILADIFVGGMMALATILPGPALADSPASPNSGSVMASVGMEFPDMDDSIASVTKVYTSIEFPSVDDFDSLVSGGTAYVSLETANVDDYDSLVKQITVLELPSDSEPVLPRPRTHQAPFLLR